MADPTLYNTPVAIEMGEALETMRGMLAETPDGATPYAERYRNPHLMFSPLTMLDGARDDANVGAVHGTAILTAALTRIVSEQARVIAEQGERIEALERSRGKAKSKAS